MPGEVKKMTSLLKISEAASLGLHTASFLAARGKETATTHEIATGLRASEAHLAKVLQRLVKAGLVESLRGPKGGFRLARPGNRMTLLNVYEAIEGRFRPEACLLGRYACGGKCILGDMVNLVNRLVSETLAGTKVSEAAADFGMAR